MKHRYLQVTFRRGKSLAAYLHLPREGRAVAVRTEDRGRGLRVDFNATGDAIGVEITAPTMVAAADVNDVLLALGLEPLPPEEWQPLRAA